MPPTPGPGAHEIKQKACAEGEQYSISGRPKDLNNPVPGPGAYDPDASKVLETAGKFSVPKNSRIMTKPADTFPVAPGSHQHKSSFGVGPQYSISQQRVQPRDLGTPGPGQYNHIPQVGNANNHSMLNQL